jgi:hypothetical protein
MNYNNIKKIINKVNKMIEVKYNTINKFIWSRNISLNNKVSVNKKHIKVSKIIYKDNISIKDILCNNIK